MQMGVSPDMILENRNVYRLLVLLALASVVVNFFFPALRSHALPNTVAMYSIRPISNYDKNLYDHPEGPPTDNLQALTTEDLFKGNLNAMDKFAAGYDAHYLNELQVIKYMQGCYGDLFTDTSNFGDINTNPNNADGNRIRTAWLNMAQAAQGTGASVCTCIDDMYAASVDMDKLGYNWGYQNAVWANYAIAQSAGPLTKSEIDKFNADTGDTLAVGAPEVENEGAFNTYVGGKATENTEKYIPPQGFWREMNQGQYLANAYSLSPKTNFDDPNTRMKYHEDITRLCIESAIPMHALAYEDTAPTALLAMIGQLLLILAAVQIYASFVHWDEKFDNPDGFAKLHKDKMEYRQKNYRNQSGQSGKDYTAESHEYKDSLSQMQWLKGLFAVGIVVVLVWQSMSEYNLFNNTDDEFMNFRRADHRHHYSPVITIFFYTTVSIAVLVTLLFEFFMLKAHTEILEDQDGHNMKNMSKIPSLWTFHRNGNLGMVLKHIASDVPLIAGFSLLGIAVLMQSNVTATHSVIGLALLLVIAGFMQHVSNVIKVLYTRICARLDASLVTQLTLYDSWTHEAKGMQKGVQARSLNPEAQRILQNSGPTFFQGNKNVVESTVRPVLQYFGYSRLYIFLLVLISAFVFIFVAKDTTHLHSLHTMMDGQLLYFTIAFVVCNVGFDVLYELLPFMFENCCTEVVRVFIILLYVIFFNLNQILYFFRIPGA